HYSCALLVLFGQCYADLYSAAAHADRTLLWCRVSRMFFLRLSLHEGNSTAPHVHFHIMDDPDPVGSNGLAYVFRSFDGLGVVANFDAMLEGKPAMISPSRLKASYARRLPLDTQLANFPSSKPLPWRARSPPDIVTA